MKTLGIILILCISLGLSSNGQDRRSWEDTGKQENKKSDVQDFRINVINGSFYDEQNLEYDAQAIAYKIDKNKESTFTFIVNSPDDNVVAKKVVHDFFVKGYNVKVIAPKVIPPTPSKQVSANTDIQNFRINVSNGLFYDEQNREYDAQSIADKIVKNKESSFTFIVNSSVDNIVTTKVVHDFFVKGYNVKVISYAPAKSPDSSPVEVAVVELVSEVKAAPAIETKSTPVINVNVENIKKIATSRTSKEAFLAILIGIGLSAACGFRVFVPFLVLSIASKFGYIHLADGLLWVDTWPALIAFSVATILETIAYFIPGFDHFMDMLSAPVVLIAGTMITASSLGDMPPHLKWSLAAISGGAPAGLIKGGIGTIRLFISGATIGMGNCIVSILELIAAVVMSILAIVIPLLCIFGVIVILFAMIGAICKKIIGSQKVQA